MSADIGESQFRIVQWMIQRLMLNHLQFQLVLSTTHITEYLDELYTVIMCGSMRVDRLLCVPSGFCEISRELIEIMGFYGHFFGVSCVIRVMQAKVTPKSRMKFLCSSTLITNHNSLHSESFSLIKFRACLLIKFRLYQ